MSKVFYVTEGAKAKCTMGLVNPKELKGTSHGVFRMNGNTALPVLNGMDNIPENIDIPGGSYNIPSFCKCKSLANIDIPRDHPELAANPALITEIEANAETVGTCNCRPLFPAPWINGATQTITGNFATLTSDCMIVCAKGFGVVSIVEEAGFRGSIDSSDGISTTVLRIEKIEVKFNYSPKFDETEFARQLAGQERGMNELTISEYLKNRARYIDEGRSNEGNAVQQVVRENAYLDKVAELRRSGLSRNQAEIEAQEWLNTQAALHNPDQIAGGDPRKADDVGDKKINSSIGPQWKYRIDAVDEHVQECIKNMTTDECENTYLNVELIYKDV